MKTARLTCASLAAVLLLAQGCVFSRTVINGQVREMDASFIRPGQTRAAEVIARLGPPPPVPAEIDLWDDQEVFTADYIRYACYEERATELNIGYVLMLPFRWKDTQAVDELLVTLGSDGTVTDVIRTRRRTLRPPLEYESSRGPPRCTRLNAAKEAKR